MAFDLLLNDLDKVSFKGDKVSFEIRFLGGASTVTGSKYLLTYKIKRILIDCGLFQGLKTLRLKNWDPFPFQAKDIDAVILTHAHIDHSGLLPKLIQQGYRGKIYSTKATRDLCRILLPDAGRLMEEEAEYLNRHKRSKHKPALPLFTEEDALTSLDYFEPVPFKQRQKIDEEISFQFGYAGHILGAAFVLIQVGRDRIVFTGDIGRSKDRIFFPPGNLPEADYLVTESTYGNRLHKSADPCEELGKIVNETAQRKGVVLIPAFAVGRAQSLIYNLWSLKKEHKIPDIPMYLNSPMSRDVTDLMNDYMDLHKIPREDCASVFGSIRYVRSVEESKALNLKKGPMIIISASGMLTGGRVLHHLKAFAPFPENTIVLAGFQAAGTRGDALEKGCEEVKVHGEYVPVKAQVKVLHNMSAHADYREIIDWFERSKINPRQVFITHGDPAAADELRRRLSDHFGWSCCAPEQNEVFRSKDAGK